MALVDYLILVPMDEEFQCVRDVWTEHVRECREIRVSDEAHYYLFRAQESGREALVVIASMGRMGLTWSALFARQAIQTWRPDCVIQIGIAGSIVGPDLRLGDVLVPGQVEGFQVGEVVDKPDPFPHQEFKFRFLSFRPTEQILGSARALTTNRGDFEKWQDTAFNRSKHEDTRTWRMSRPNIHVGEKEWLASGNFVVKSNGFAEMIRAKYPLVKAVDMEALGLHEALLNFGPDAPSNLFVRGISDYADPDKNQLERGSDGRFRRAAARSATQFIVDLVLRRLRLKDTIRSERLAFPPKLQKLARTATREHGLEPLGAGSRALVLAPILRATTGATELTKLTATVENSGAGGREHALSLRQRKGPWTRFLDAHNVSGQWTWTINRSTDPYELSLAFVGENDSLKLNICAVDEFGREARLSWEEINELYNHSLE